MFGCLHASSRSRKRPQVLNAGPGAAGDALAVLASEFSPLVERTAADTVIFSIAGLERLIGSPQQVAAEVARRGNERGVDANFAIAHNPDTAMLAARHFTGITLIPPGKEADRLGGIPIGEAFLSLCEIAAASCSAVLCSMDTAPALLETLDRWGIRTLADLAELPEIGLAERLGEPGVWLRKLALGRTRRPLKIAVPPYDFERHLELDHPLDLIEPLLFLLASLLGELTDKLEELSLATNRVHLALELEKSSEGEKKPEHRKNQHCRTLEFPVPVRDPKILLKHLQLDLEAHPPSDPVVALRVRLNPTRPRVLQNGLFVPASPEPDKLHVILARVTGLVGEGRAGSPEILNTHRPDAFRMREFTVDQTVSGNASTGHRTGHFQTTHPNSPLRLSFRVFRPALAATVRLAKICLNYEQPAQVAAPGIRGNVLAAAGPWRSAGEWWTDTCWARDEWDISLSDGALYRLYWDLRSEGWFVGGMYD